MDLESCLQGSCAIAIMIASLRSIIYFITVYLFVNINSTEFIDVFIGGQPIYFQPQKQSSDAYDGISQYLCKEGDTIDLICKRKYNEGQIRLRFYDRFGAVVVDIATQDQRHKNINFNFRMLLNDKQFNQSYADCTYLSSNNSEQKNFTYRTVFTATPRSSNGFIVIVNDKTLTTKIHDMDGADIYTYKYSYEQLLNITCAKKNQLLPGDIHGGIINRRKQDITTQEIINQTFIYTALIKTRNLNGTIFQCYSEFEKNKLVAQIKLLETNRDPIVLGLTPGKILYEYNIDNMDWTIHYQCTAHEVLNLTCVTGNDRLPEWEYPKYNTSEIHTYPVYKTNYINNIFPMNTEFNNNITCKSTKLDSKRKVAIVFHQMLDLTPQETYLDADEKQFTVPEIIGIVAAILIAIVAGLFFVCYWRGWRKKIDTKEEGLSRSIGTVSKSLRDREQKNEYIENVNKDTNSQDGATIINAMVSDNSQDYGYQIENTIYTRHTEGYFTKNGDTIHTRNGDTMNNICKLPNRVQNRIKDKHQAKRYDNSVSDNETNPITYKNLERIDEDTNYTNLEHLRNPCYSKLCYSQDYGYQIENTIYTRHTEDYFTKNGDTIDGNTMNNICKLPNRVQNRIKDKHQAKRYDNSVSDNKTNPITYKNLERIDEDTNYTNLEHLRNPCYSNLCSDISTKIEEE